MKNRIHGVYAVTPSTEDTPALLDLCRQALEGGVRALQLRNKGPARRTRLKQAEHLRTLTDAFDALLVVNDDVEVAARAGVDGVHLGQADRDVHGVRNLDDGLMFVGVSCHNSVELARHAVSEDAAYVSFGAVHPSTTKPDAVRCGLDVIRDARAQMPDTCIVAIGGITAQNAAETAAAGADAIAVCAGLFGAPDVTKAARELARAFGNGR